MTLLNFILLALVFTINGFSLGVLVCQWWYIKRQEEEIYGKLKKRKGKKQEPRDPWEKPPDWWKS